MKTMKNFIIFISALGGFRLQYDITPFLYTEDCLIFYPSLADRRNYLPELLAGSSFYTQRGKKRTFASLSQNFIKSPLERSILEKGCYSLDLNNPSEYEIYKQLMNDEGKIKDLSMGVSQNTVNDGKTGCFPSATGESRTGGKQYFEISSKYPYSPTYLSRKISDNHQIPIHKITGLNTKIGINVWYELNFGGINREDIQPNKLFREQFLRFKDRISEVEQYYYHELNCFKNNDFIRRKNFYSYLTNIPNSSIKSHVQRLI
jgi:hypothetical protein